MTGSIEFHTNFDVLSLVFVFCAETDWKMPLRIACVCHLWRTTILHTPRAWCFIDMRVSKECYEVYFKRSQPYKLHLARPFAIEDIAQVAPRVQCLTSLPLPRKPPSWSFPALTTLRSPADSNSFNYYVDAGRITASLFPNLRHLELQSVWLSMSPVFPFPPLETLSIDAQDAVGWPTAIASCSTSLTSLEIAFKGRNWGMEYESSIHLPRLCYLKVCLEVDPDTGDDYRWNLEMRTPNLQTYIEDYEGDQYAHEMHRDTESVTYLRLRRLPSLTALPHVRVLQLQLGFNHVRAIKRELKVNPLVCPLLEVLEFNSGGMTNWEMEEAHKLLVECDWKDRTGLLPPTIKESWSTELPGRHIPEVCINRY